jgi:hypothetical protein
VERRDVTEAGVISNVSNPDSCVDTKPISGPGSYKLLKMGMFVETAIIAFIICRLRKTNFRFLFLFAQTNKQMEVCHFPFSLRSKQTEVALH